MAVVQTLIGNVKGPAGATGATGATGAPGAAATITVGSTTTTAYGNAASVTNSGTTAAAVLDFVIPQGKPGEATTKMGDLLLDSITSSAADFPSPQVGDTGKTAFGKINKFFSDALAKFTQHESDIATISTSPTTRAFNAGEFLVYEGQLYRVTTNIANGGTLTVGTNITSTSVGSELTTLAPKTLTYGKNSHVDDTRVLFSVVGKIVFLSFAITTDTSISSGTNLLVAQSGYSTSQIQDIPIMATTGTGYRVYVNGRNIVTNGALPAGTYTCNATYIID